MTTPVTIQRRELTPHKAAVAPLLDARTVLTKSPWEFVSLWLERQKKKQDALFYWNQARGFARAAVGVSVDSAPLLHYYTFMNAAKALLAAKGVAFQEGHGVGADNIRLATNKRIELANEGIKIKGHGILPSLAGYLGDTETRNSHTLKELFFNLPFIHRSYCLTYKTQADQYYPLKDCKYVFDNAAGQAHMSAQLSGNFTTAAHVKKLPVSFIPDPNGGADAIRSTATATIAGPRVTKASDIAALVALNQKVRVDLQYINGIQTLWYVKARVSGPQRLDRSTLTLTLAAMHRLSEICRYRPLQLAALLAGQRNWLISEFVFMSSEQFLDGIAAELTGHQFMIPNVRAPN